MEQPPSTKEARVSPVNLRIKFRSETIEQFVERYAVDVSRGGIFIRTREPLAVGTQLKFDFQLQNTSPLMAGEGTVVWIREHDPTRAGVTPGMGVRFDRLTPASQPVLERILVDKGKREPTGPSAASAPATASGKSGAGPLPARRASSTFSALDPAAAASVAGAPHSTAGGSSPTAGTAPPSPQTGATLSFGAVTNAAALAATLKPLVAPSPGGGVARVMAPPSTSAPISKPVLSSPSPPSASGTPSSGGALPTLESQSALGRLATGPNLGASAPLGGATRTQSPLPLTPKPGTPAAGVASESRANASGTAAVPTAVDDSERTQIADGVPDFANEPTHVGGQALGIAAVIAGRPAISATSRRTPMPSPDPRLAPDPKHSDPKLSLDDGMGSSPGMTSSRTTSPDGTTKADGPAAIAAAAGRLSASLPLLGTAAAEAGTGAGAGTGTGTGAGSMGPAPGAAGTLDSDLARTIPAAARIIAVTATVPSTTPHATPRVQEKKRPTALIVIGIVILLGAAAAGAIAIWTSNGDSAATVATSSTPAPTPAAGAAPVPAAAPAPTPAPEGTPPAPAAPGTEPKPGEAPVAAAKPAEAMPENKPAEAKPAEAKPAEAQPAEPAPVIAEAGPVKPGRKPRLIGRKKGAVASKADAALEAAAGIGEEGAGAAEGPAANIARIISLPTAAEVLVDGQLVGKTPFTGRDIDPVAPHALTVRKDGFETYEHMLSASDWVKAKGNGQSLKVVVKLHKAHALGEGEAADKKAEKPAEPGAAEPAKAEAPPATAPP